MNTNLTRRTLIRTMVGAGGGMLLGFHVPGASAAVVAPKPWTTPGDGSEINAWLSIDADGTVTIRVPHSEQGQGALTSVAMMVAEELDVPWKNVQTVFADINRHVNYGGEYISTRTSGSAVVRRRHPHIMQAGASARERLKEAAARIWKVKSQDVVAKQGVLSSGGHQGDYSEFAELAAQISLDSEPAIKTPDQWWLLGKPIPRVDIPVKVNGSAQYAIDTRLPNMAYAAVRCCPVPWGKLKHFDADAIKGRKGVIEVVELKAVPGKGTDADMQNGVAVVADTWFRAKTALDMLPVEWEFGADGEVS
ncbi:MAG: molybdopterin-dependent oxidoreductase, partial [Gammaproteobacteria bacterium]|nr:molybdopterin-dependent oxidoreductase [Gammaproteobacteria bacterium]